MIYPYFTVSTPGWLVFEIHLGVAIRFSNGSLAGSHLAAEHTSHNWVPAVKEQVLTHFISNSLIFFEWERLDV